MLIACSTVPAAVDQREINYTTEGTRQIIFPTQWFTYSASHKKMTSSFVSLQCPLLCLLNLLESDHRPLCAGPIQYRSRLWIHVSTMGRLGNDVDEIETDHWHPGAGDNISGTPNSKSSLTSHPSGGTLISRMTYAWWHLALETLTSINGIQALSRGARLVFQSTAKSVPDVRIVARQKNKIKQKAEGEAGKAQHKAVSRSRCWWGFCRIRTGTPNKNQ